MTSDVRGQTAQDFAVGIGVFLVTVSFVFAYAPTALPVSAEESNVDAAVADRIAENFITDFAVPGYTRRLNYSKTTRFFTVHNGSETIRTNYSLPQTASVNVTLEYANGTAVENVTMVHSNGTTARSDDVYAGDAFRNRTTALVSRVVIIDESRYRLLVRVW